jgi:hypothetical protein
MSTTVRDASWITKKNRDVALYSWKNQQTTAVNNGVNTVLAEQPNTQSGQVISNRNLGCMYCQTNVSVTAVSNVVTYPFVGSGGGGATGGAFPGQ